MVGDVQAVIVSGLGAEIVTTTVEGRECYGVSAIPCDLRNDPTARIPFPRSYMWPCSKDNIDALAFYR